MCAHRSAAARGSVSTAPARRRATTAAAPTPFEAPAPDAALGARQVLCVDDDEASLDAMTGLLERGRIESNTAPAEDAAAVLGDEPMDAAILDYDLGPEAPNGLELAERLRAVRDVPCLLVTANRDRAIAARARDLGVTVLYKPLAPAKLRAALSQATRGSADEP